MFPPQAGPPAQVGSQAGAAWQHLGAEQHEGAAQAGLQQRRLNKPQPLLQQVGLQQGVLQAGAELQQLGAVLQPPLLQAGAASQHEGLLQHFDSQQLLVQPQPLAPSIRSRSSKPKPWVQVARPSTNDPRSMFHFIDRRLLYKNLSVWRCPDFKLKRIGRRERALSRPAALQSKSKAHVSIRLKRLPAGHSWAGSRLNLGFTSLISKTHSPQSFIQ